MRVIAGLEVEQRFVHSTFFAMTDGLTSESATAGLASTQEIHAPNTGTMLFFSVEERSFRFVDPSQLKKLIRDLRFASRDELRLSNQKATPRGPRS